jgi:hypothetical protein
MGNRLQRVGAELSGLQVSCGPRGRQLHGAPCRRHLCRSRQRPDGGAGVLVAAAPRQRACPPTSSALPALVARPPFTPTYTHTPQALEELSLADNELQALEPQALQGLTSLKRLHLYGNQLRELPLQALTALPQLQVGRLGRRRWPAQQPARRPAASAVRPLTRPQQPAAEPRPAPRPCADAVAGGQPAGACLCGAAAAEPALHAGAQDARPGHVPAAGCAAAPARAAAGSSAASSSAASSSACRQLRSAAAAPGPLPCPQPSNTPHSARVPLPACSWTPTMCACLRAGVDPGLVNTALAGGVLRVGEVLGSGRGYFKLQLATAPSPQAGGGWGVQRAPVLVVALGSAPGTPNWGGLLSRLARTQGAPPPRAAPAAPTAANIPPMPAQSALHPTHRHHPAPLVLQASTRGSTTCCTWWTRRAPGTAAATRGCSTGSSGCGGTPSSTATS